MNHTNNENIEPRLSFDVLMAKDKLRPRSKKHNGFHKWEKISTDRLDVRNVCERFYLMDMRKRGRNF